jgi:hypothetical protein
MDNLRGSNVESKSLWEFIISVGRIKRTLDLHEIINELNALFYQFFLLDSFILSSSVAWKD